MGWDGYRDSFVMSITYLPGELHAGGVHHTGVAQLHNISGQQTGTSLAQIQPTIEVPLGREKKAKPN